MPKWKKDATEFIVSMNYHQIRGYQSSIPKPVVEFLGKPDYIKFIIIGKRVEVHPHKN